MTSYKYHEQAQCKTLEELVALGRKRGYLNPEHWAQKIWAARQKHKSSSYVTARF